MVKKKKLSIKAWVICFDTHGLDTSQAFIINTIASPTCTPSEASLFKNYTFVIIEGKRSTSYPKNSLPFATKPELNLLKGRLFKKIKKGLQNSLIGQKWISFQTHERNEKLSVFLSRTSKSCLLLEGLVLRGPFNRQCMIIYCGKRDCSNVTIQTIIRISTWKVWLLFPSLNFLSDLNILYLLDQNFQIIF